MQMTGYTKLFGSIVASTVWREPHTVRIVWITMLALANKNGIVEASVPGLADLSRVTMDECKEALEALKSPDEYSRTTDHEGRRIKECDGGWVVLNHAKYRAKMGVDERREYLRQKQKENRERKRGVNNASTNVNNCSDLSTESTHTEAEAQSETKPKAFGVKKQNSPVSIPDSINNPEFAVEWEHFKEHRKKSGNPMTARAEELILNKLAQRPKEALAAIQTCIANAWRGFEWSWFDNTKGSNQSAPAKPRFQTPEERYAEAVKKNPNYI